MYEFFLINIFSYFCVGIVVTWHLYVLGEGNRSCTLGLRMQANLPCPRVSALNVLFYRKMKAKPEILGNNGAVFLESVQPHNIRFFLLKQSIFIKTK